MKQKKVRGQHRRHKQIEVWRLENLSLDLNTYLTEGHERYYAKIRISPWSDLCLTNSVVPEPRGKTRKLMLNALLDIYENWKAQLDKLGVPYYLKVWLFEPRFSQSQIVCAIGDGIDFYRDSFYKPDEGKEMPLDSYGSLKARLAGLDWGYYWDEEHHDSTELGEPGMYASMLDYEDSKRWFDKLLKSPHRKHAFTDSIGDEWDLYSFRRGNVWVGGNGL